MTDLASSTARPPLPPNGSESAPKADYGVIEDSTPVGQEQPQAPASSVEKLHLDHLLALAVENGASDLHVAVDTAIRVRINGRLEPIIYQNHRLFADTQQSARLLGEIISESQAAHLAEHHELDFAYSPESIDARFRCNYFYAQGSLRAVFRQIPSLIKTIDELQLPEEVRKLTQFPRGLVLVTGPTGSGKSTTLAAMIDEINRGRDEHILTIEDPVEFVHQSKRSLVNQREVGADTHSFANALRAALREDPDIILVGELRDPETISLGITAAETGHLVFATLHTQDASQTVDRLIDSFPPDQQAQIRTQLSLTLQGVVSQQLMKTADGKGRVVACEILTTTDAVRNYLREGQTEQLYSMMQTGAQAGMQTMEAALVKLVEAGTISRQHAIDQCSKPEEFDRMMASSLSGGK